MIVLLNTSTPVCRLTFIDGEARSEVEWEAGRELAKGLIGFLESELAQRNKTFSDLSAIGAFQGPGSFTGLRIGLTVLNTLAESLAIPIVGESGEDWQDRAVERLKMNDNDQIVLPLYGSEARVTSPRK